ncbi:hypothetical protein [Clostridium hydrogeniformans]|uniref:hypothetical protein n=1 Tax=Clostridium hydrogeniformans TaxID=349933 RepID=UPI00055836B7|nr:hypothetical protein [Clostridium hydrogeniformans]
MKIKSLILKIVESCGTKYGAMTLGTKIATAVIAGTLVVGGTAGVIYNNHTNKKVEVQKEEEKKEVVVVEDDKVQIENENVETEIEKKIEDGNLTEDEVKKLVEDGKISNDKAKEIKEKVYSKKQEDSKEKEKSSNNVNGTNSNSENNKPSNNGSSNSGNNGSSNNGSGNSNNGSGNSNSGNGSENKPKPQPQPSVKVGIDWNLTNKLNTLVVSNTETYKGIKKETLKDLAKQVALGNISKDQAVNKVSGMSWEENAQKIDPYLPGESRKITPFDIRCSKFNVSGNATAEDISMNYSFNLGQFGAVYAYRNKDNSVTITSMGCQFALSK